MITDKISEQDLTKYNASAKICGIVMDELIQKIQGDILLNIQELQKYGDSRIIEECSKIYKREKCGIAYPTSICLNNCVGNYIYEEDERNTIEPNDIVKITLGVTVGGCVADLGKTIMYKIEQEEYNDTISYIMLLEELQDYIVENAVVGETNDEIRINIESKCTEFDCFPVENTISYNSDKSAYMILNYKKYYDNNDELTSLQNLCFDFEEGEVYSIDLKIICNGEDPLTYMQPYEPHIYQFNDNYYNLKLKTSREFLKIVKGEHGTNAFNCLPYKQIPMTKAGIRECLKNNILTTHPIIYNKNNFAIFSKKFTIIVGKEKTVMLKYNKS